MSQAALSSVSPAFGVSLASASDFLQASSRLSMCSQRMARSHTSFYWQRHCLCPRWEGQAQFHQGLPWALLRFAASWLRRPWSDTRTDRAETSRYPSRPPVVKVRFLFPWLRSRRQKALPIDADALLREKGLSATKARDLRAKPQARHFFGRHYAHHRSAGQDTGTD